MASPATPIMPSITAPDIPTLLDYTNPKILLTAVLIILILIILRPNTPLSHLPGPFLSRYTTLPLKLAILSGNRTLYIHALHKTYGPTIRIAPSEAAIASLPSFKLIHRVGASGFRKSDWYQKFVDSEGAPGLFAETDVKKHGARRRLFAGSFSKTSILGFEERVRGKVEMGVRKMKKEGRTDVLKWWTFVATDAVADLSFGRSFGMLEKEEKDPYIHDLETVMVISGISAELSPLVAIAKYLPIPRLQHALQLSKRILSYGVTALQNHRTYIEQNPNTDNTAHQTLFSRFLDPARSSDLSDTDLAAEAGSLIIAGSDTTAVTLTYLVWSVLHPRNTAMKQKLLSELSDVPRDAPYAVIERLEYLGRVTQETLRLYGAAPGSLPRVVPDGGTVLDGFSIAGGVTVSTQGFTMHRDEKIWEEPETFNPDRWAEPTRDMLDAFHSFGAGARACIGIHLAMLELLTGAFVFFKECPSAVLAPETTDETMEFENYFLIAPKSHKCEIIIE